MSYRLKGADLRPQFAKWGLPLKSQGGRPTCSVFVITAALEFAAAQRHQAGFILSEEYLNWASNEAIGEPADGGFFSDLWKGYEKHGICEARLAPYREAFDDTWEPDRTARRQAHTFREDAYELSWIKAWDVNTGLSDEEFDAVLQAIRSGLPVCAGLRWPRSPEWDDGVLRLCTPEEVFDGHSVLMVGFRPAQASGPSQGAATEPAGSGATPEPGGVIIFKDSGSGGRYASMPFEYARLYANDAAVISD